MRNVFVPLAAAFFFYFSRWVYFFFSLLLFVALGKVIYRKNITFSCALIFLSVLSFFSSGLFVYGIFICLFFVHPFLVCFFIFAGIYKSVARRLLRFLCKYNQLKIPQTLSAQCIFANYATARKPKKENQMWLSKEKCLGITRCIYLMKSGSLSYKIHGF